MHANVDQNYTEFESNVHGDQGSQHCYGNRPKSTKRFRLPGNCGNYYPTHEETSAKECRQKKRAGYERNSEDYSTQLFRQAYKHTAIDRMTSRSGMALKHIVIEDCCTKEEYLQIKNISGYFVKIEQFSI